MTIVIENTTPTTVMTAAASEVRISLAASAVPLMTPRGQHHIAVVGSPVDRVRRDEQQDRRADLDRGNEPEVRPERLATRL